MKWDYDIVIKAYCISSDSANVGGYIQSGLLSIPYCTCPAFKFGKRDKNGNKTCKHIEQAIKEGCFWNELYSSEIMTEKGVCPKCGGDVSYAKVAV